jgi:hypothetical protein
MQINIPRYNLSFKPWEDWQKQINPNWWTSYNNVKHQRDLHYNEATLETALNSVAGLFCGIMYYFRIMHGKGFSILPFPQLLDAQNYSSGQGASFTWDFNLPDDF